MSKKRILTFSLAILYAFSLLSFSSCKKKASESTSESESQVEIIESTTGIEYTLSSNGDYYIISGYNGTAKKVVCGETHKGLPIKEIGKNAFCNSTLESLTISSSIEKIGDYAFFNCDELTHVDLGNGLKEIGEYAFSACKTLSHVSLPEGLKTLGNHVFYSSNVINVSIPESIEFIGLGAFDSCDSLQFNKYDNAYYLGNTENKFTALIYFGEEIEVSIDVDGVPIKTTITGNPSETSCAVNTSTKVIAGGAFEKHVYLEKVTITQNVTAIGDLAFFGCSSLKTVILPHSLKTIGVSAFAYCSISSINLPEKLEKIGDGAFSHCRLTQIYVPDTVKEIAPYTFNECRYLTKVDLGTSIEAIGEYAFFGCSSLSLVLFDDYFNSKINSIGAFAFGDCNNLITIAIPSSIKVIEEKPFSDFTSTIYCFHTKNQWNEAGLSDNANLSRYDGKIYLYSESAPSLNEDETAYDGRFFYLNEENIITPWVYSQA